MEFGGIVRDLSPRRRLSFHCLLLAFSVSHSEQCQSVFSLAEFNLNCLSTVAQRCGSELPGEMSRFKRHTGYICEKNKEFPSV